MFDVAVHNEFDFFGGEYPALFARARATAFQHPLWLDRIYKWLAPCVGAVPLIITIRARRDGSLVSVLPLLRRRFRGVTTVEYADLGVSDYAAPIYAPQDEDALSQDVRCSAEIRRALKPFDLIRLVKIRDDGPLFSRAFGSLSSSPMCFSSHAVRLFAPFSEWREKTLDQRFARFLDRKRKQLRKKGQLRFRTVTDSNELEQVFKVLREFRASRFHSGDVLQNRDFFRFYLDIAKSGHDCGLSRTQVLCLDSEPIAVAFGLVDRRTLRVLLVGFDFVRYRNQSVGLLMIESLAANCIDRGETILDLTIGDEPYKASFGTEPTNMLKAWSGAGLIGSVASELIKYGDLAGTLVSQLRTKKDKIPARPHLR